MISVVLIGRNDSHGYHLVKRVALSLNMTAALLTDPADEIVFVDYNTPDPLPTLPEALSDTLTEHTRQRMRILRVRPSQHAARTRKSALPLIGVLAANVGIRRSSSANRWILFSTTDMLVISNDAAAASLSELGANLDDATYQLPRYELPELIWDTFDRKDPAGTALRLRHYGRTLHLTERVKAEPPCLFDNPGDFLMVLRRDLFEIDGLDERTIFGWQHVDANLLRRTELLPRRALSLGDHLEGYHCSHTITLNPTNTTDRLENDEATFVHEVSKTHIPSQRENWGLAQENIEEISLLRPHAVRAITALESELAPPMLEPLEVGRLHRDFNRADYLAQHVAPYIANLLAFSQYGSSVGWLGHKGHLHDIVARWLGALETDNVVVDLDDRRERGPLPVEMRWVIVNLGIDALEPSPSPRYVHDLPAAEQQPIWRALSQFLGHVQEDQTASTDPGRQYIALNAIHTVFESAVTRSLHVAKTPYASRLRAGPVRRDSELPLAIEMTELVKRALGHADTPAVTEVSRAYCQALLSAADPSVPIETPNPASIAILKAPGFPRLVGADAPMLQRTIETQEKSRISNRLAGRSALPLDSSHSHNAPPALCKLAASEDWENAAWRRWGEFFESGSYDYFTRHRATWVRAHLLYGLDKIGLLDPATSLAVITRQADDFYLRLRVLRGGISLFALSDGAVTEEWRSRKIAAPPWTDPITPLSEVTGELFDAVVVLPDCLPRDPRDAAIARICEFLRLVKPGGVLALSAEISIDRRDSSAWIPVGWVKDGTLRRRSGAKPLTPFDNRLSALTLDRTQLPENRSHPHMILDDNGDLITSGVWFARA